MTDHRVNPYTPEGRQSAIEAVLALGLSRRAAYRAVRIEEFGLGNLIRNNDLRPKAERLPADTADRITREPSILVPLREGRMTVSEAKRRLKVRKPHSRTAEVERLRSLALRLEAEDLEEENDRLRAKVAELEPEVERLRDEADRERRIAELEEEVDQLRSGRRRSTE